MTLEQIIARYGGVTSLDGRRAVAEAARDRLEADRPSWRPRLVEGPPAGDATTLRVEFGGVGSAGSAFVFVDRQGWVRIAVTVPPRWRAQVRRALGDLLALHPRKLHQWIG